MQTGIRGVKAGQGTQRREYMNNGLLEEKKEVEQEREASAHPHIGTKSKERKKKR